MSDVILENPQAVSQADQRSYVDWPAIFAGTVVASAISAVLLTFGAAVGLSLTSAYEGQGISLAAFAIAAALWVVWVQVSGFLAGGYLTGRVRRRHYDATEDESDIRDGIHGLAVWGVGVIVGVMIAYSGAAGLASTATSAASSIAGGAATAAASSADDIAASADIYVDRLLRSQAPQTGATADDSRDQIRRVLLAAVTSGTLSDPDKAYLVQTVATRAGLPAEEAQKRVDELYAQAQQAEATARDAADKARRLSVVAAFVTAASLLIGAVGAYFGAILGGNHRDKKVVIDGWSRFQ